MSDQAEDQKLYAAICAVLQTKGLSKTAKSLQKEGNLTSTAGTDASAFGTQLLAAWKTVLTSSGTPDTEPASADESESSDSDSDDEEDGTTSASSSKGSDGVEVTIVKTLVDDEAVESGSESESESGEESETSEEEDDEESSQDEDDSDDESSDSDADVYEDAQSSAQAETAAKAATALVIAASGALDAAMDVDAATSDDTSSESDSGSSSSSDDGAEVATVQPVLPTGAESAETISESSSESESSEEESDDETDSDDEDQLEVIAAPENGIVVVAPIGTVESATSDSSSEEEEEEESSSEEESDPSESSESSEEEEDSDDSSDEESTPAAVQVTTTTTVTETTTLKRKREDETSSEEDSGSDESSSSSGSDSDDEAPVASALPVATVTAVHITKKQKVETIDPSASFNGSNAASSTPNGKSAAAIGSANGKGKKPENKRFERVKVAEVSYLHNDLVDNSFESRLKYGARQDDYGAKASRDLIVTKGDGFRKEKNKKKRGSYAGGTISMESHSIKFD